MSNKDDWIKENVSLAHYNTFGIEAKAAFFCEIKSIEDLQSLLANPKWQKVPKFILGEGSNILLTQDFPGLVIKMAITGINCHDENADHVLVTAGGGENWHDLVLFCLNRQYAGVENLSLIPGTVGAAPMQNIGAYGVELTQVFEKLTAIRIQDGETHQFDRAACCFGYRYSVFKGPLKNQYIIVSVTLKLQKKPIFHIDYGELRKTLDAMKLGEMNLKAISDAVIKLRTEKLPNPKIIGNAGSFFKNPIISAEKFKIIQNDFPNLPHYSATQEQFKIPAAWLIEQCHWKGRRIGSVGVHEKHALVLVNYGGGTGKEIQQLSADIQSSVYEKFGIQLRSEVNII